MNKEEIIEKLKKLWEELDNIQEQDIVQENGQAMWEVGEAMGAIDNAIDELENQN